MWSLFCHFGIFWRHTFSVTAPVRHLRSTKTENLGSQNLVVSRRQLNCLSSGKCSQSLHKPKPAPVSHLEFLTSPPKLNPLNLQGQSWSQQRKESTGASSLLGASSPGVFTLFSHTSTFKESCRRLSPQAPVVVPYCELGMSLAVTAVLSHGLPGAVCQGIPWDFSWTSWCRVWGVSDVSDDKNTT